MLRFLGKTAVKYDRALVWIKIRSCGWGGEAIWKEMSVPVVTCLCCRSESWCPVSDRWCWHSWLDPTKAGGRCGATKKRRQWETSRIEKDAAMRVEKWDQKEKKNMREQRECRREQEEVTPLRHEGGRQVGRRETRTQGGNGLYLLAQVKQLGWTGSEEAAQNRGVRRGRWGWRHRAYLTATSSVNLSTRCVRMLRGKATPANILWAGLPFRHAGRVELCAAGPAHTQQTREGTPACKWTQRKIYDSCKRQKNK